MSYETKPSLKYQKKCDFLESEHQILHLSMDKIDEIWSAGSSPRDQANMFERRKFICQIRRYDHEVSMKPSESKILFSAFLALW